MLTSISIRWRLTLWYFATLAGMLGIVAAGTWFAMRLSLDHALDRDLSFQLMGLRHFIAANSDAGGDELRDRLAQIAGLGDLFQIYGSDGRLICQSSGLARHHVSALPPADAGSTIRYRAAGTPEFPLRVAYQHVKAGSEILTLEAAEPVGKFETALREFTSLLWMSLPLLLLVATIGGYWLSSRALRPVDQLTTDARGITATNLSGRLAVPAAHDELRRLAETLNQMLDRIEGSFQQVRRFTADASHELRTPLTLIHTAAEFTLRRERSREELQESMRKILRESKRTAQLVDDLLWLARTDSDRNGFQSAAVDLAPLLREVAEEGAALAAGKDIAVVLELSASRHVAQVDVASFRRLLLILLDNALKYTPGGGKVRLESRREDGDLIIAVRDDGIGIAPEDLPHVFERFWRADGVRSREAGGTGLGLSIAKEIADRHHACLTVASVLGQGSTFTVRVRSDG